ncbi:hypothetical protein [Thioalkalivibrio sp. ALE11]|uniref:hypothetical protein n=1 Tax=Thioalkalivibrio sp. ALE11 TaxID=1265494 RepID=UPI0012DF2BF7
MRDVFLNPKGLGMLALKGGGRAITRKGSFEGVLRDSLYSSYKKLFPETQSPIFPNASEVQKAFPYEWENYYKFCFVRNPYSKMVSDYFWRRSLKGSEVGFDEFVRRAYFESIEGKKQDDLLPSPITNWPLYTIEDNVVMDYVGFFESLDLDFYFVASKLDLPVDAMALPELKKRSGLFDYRDIYTEVSRELVYSLCSKEIDEHKYSF